MARLINTYLLQPLLDLVFPQHCAHCASLLNNNETILCFACNMDLPFTDARLDIAQAAEIKFYGRLKTEKVIPLLYFVGGGLVQELMHQLKYKNRPEIGAYLGNIFAEKYRNSPWLQSVEVIVPVPLFPKKEFKRGYNQSYHIAKGIGDALQKPVLEKAVLRTKNTESQTNKTREERQSNVANVFAVNQVEKLRGKHVLLVDDVLTTGATLSSCGKTILAIPDTKISIATMAIATQ